MTAYREISSVDLSVETSAVVELLLQTRRLRRRVGLPFLVLALLAGQAGIFSHVLGYWALLGTFDDGTYMVNAITIVISGAICAAPPAVVGVTAYCALRWRVRRSWSAEFRRKNLRDSWLEQTAKRFV